jgi:hypothetical protein
MSLHNLDILNAVVGLLSFLIFFIMIIRNHTSKDKLKQ